MPTFDQARQGDTAPLSQRLRHPRLRAKILGGVLLAAVLALGAQFAISYVVASNSIDRLEASRVADHLTVAGDVLGDHRAALELLAVDAGSPLVAPHVVSRDLPWLRKEVVDRLMAAHRVDLIVVLDGRGSVLAGSSRLPAAASAAPIMRSAALGSAGSAWATWNGKLWLVAAAPILVDQPAEQRVGTVVVADQVDSRFVASLERASGSRIAFLLGDQVAAVTDRAILPLVANIVAAPSGRGTVHAAQGYSGDRLALPLVAGRASMVAAEARTPIVATQRGLLHGTLLAALGAMAVAALIGSILSRQLVRPLSSLTGAAHAFAAGDLHRRVTVSSRKRDEINDLGQAFNHMATQIEDAQETLRQAAIRDGLTGLLNQREFFRRLAAEVSRADRGDEPVSVLMIDLDHLKAVNDTFGHLYGDAVLSEVARMIEATVREGDAVARYAGDEFVGILTDADAERALGVGERILAGAAGVAVAAGLPARVVCTLSIGAVTRPTGRWNPNRTVELADEALYRAKRAGRNRVEVGADTR